MKVHENVRRIRKSKGVTQVFMAKKMKIPVQTYNGYELGRRMIKAELLNEIAEILNEPIENFFKEKIYDSKNSEKKEVS